jgi:hypothetical protein
MPDHDISAAPQSSADRPPAPQTAGSGGPDLGPLDSADAAFRALTTGPCPLGLNPARLARGLPDRQVALGELRALLLHPATGATARNRVWAELVRRARTGGPAWMIGLTGVAMPGLRRAVAAWSPGYRGDLEDLQTEVLTGFLAAVRALDLDGLEAVPLASRLCWAAWRAGQAHACADAAWAARTRELGAWLDGPVKPWGHPDFVLAAAVHAGVLTAGDAELIGRTRLEKVPLAQIARELGVRHSALCMRRSRAETKIAAAIRAGQFENSWPLM